MSEQHEADSINPEAHDAFLDTECLIQAIRAPRMPSQHSEDGGNGQSTPQAAKIAPPLKRVSTHSVPQPKLLHVKERTRTTTDEVHPGWIRATSILLRGMERLRAREIEEARSAGRANYAD